MENKSIVLIELEKENVVGSKATMIETAFAPMVATLKEYETEFNEIAKLELNDEASARARTLRLKYVKLRTGTVAIHKEQKAEILREGRAIDAVKNLLEFAVVANESALEKVEKHFENLEKDRLNAIRIEREAQLKALGYDIGAVDCSKWDDSMFDTVIIGLKKKADDLKELERIETERIETERLAKIETERIESERIEAERVAQVERERIAKIEADRLAKELAQATAKIEADRLESDRLAKIEKEKNDKILADLEAKRLEDKKIADKKLADEKAKTEAIAKELKDKADAEYNAKVTAESEAKARALAPEKERMLYWINGIELLSVDVTSQEANAKAVEIKEKFIAFKKWAKEQINQI